jgi:hypothetical protein
MREPREVVEEAMIIAETAMDFNAEHEEPMSENVRIALSTIATLLRDLLDGTTQAEEEISLDDYTGGDDDGVCDAR